MESAAALVRALPLEGDACSCLKALADVGCFCRQLPYATMWVKTARAEWRTRAESNAVREGGYQVMLGEAVEGCTAELTDRMTHADLLRPARRSTSW